MLIRSVRSRKQKKKNGNFRQKITVSVRVFVYDSVPQINTGYRYFTGPINSMHFFADSRMLTLSCASKVV